MQLKGSKTEKNLYTAFTGEVQANAKYLYFADVAKKEGYEQIAEILEYTAKNELEHAKLWFERLGFLKTTEENLTDASSNEHFEWSELYKEFAKTAKDEGFEQIARLFEGVGNIEKTHEERFNALISNMENNEVFKKDTEVIWECRNCGHKHYGPNAPEVCPICGNKEAYFQIYPENY